MLHLIMENPIRFILALLIGIATAWWIWGRLTHAESAAEEPAAPRPAPEPAPTPEPAPAPAPEVVEPVAPVAAAAPIAAAATDAEPKPKIAAAVGAPDDLRKINGIGPKLCDLCNSLGVTRFDQIAQWGEQEIAEVDGYLGSFKGRIDRDNWVEQAKLLASGQMAAWEARFGYKSE